MQWQYFVALLVCLLVASAVAQQTADGSANAKTKQILSYIAGLPQQGKVLSGQFAGYSPDTYNNQQINEIAQQTGQTPAILACDWACGWNYKTPPENIIDYSCNPSLKEHWSKGGYVAINMHLPNPSSSNGGGYKERGNLHFPDLLNTNSETGQRWRRFLDRMAQGLDDLQRAGVTVLFRPLHEMNGDWFYWCDQDAETFKNVWRNMFNYLTNTKNLHNILWVYSPDQSRAGPARFYPGASYVDIVGLDAYLDDPNGLNGYNEMINLNKPFALTEVGPSTTNRQFDYNKWLTAIQSRFPRVAYFLAWNDDWSPIRNPNAYSFFNNPRVVNRGQIGSNSNNGGTTTSGSTVLYNFSNGVGQWKGTNVAGGPWRSNEFVVKSSDSLKADIKLSAGQKYNLFTQESSTIQLSGRKRLTAEVRVASWGFPNGGSLTVKLYVKTGSGWTWYDSGSTQLNSGATRTVTVDLTKLSSGSLGDGKEVGVEFTSNANGDQTSVYLSSISAE